MTLNEWVGARGPGAVAELAKLSGVTRQTLYNRLRGQPISIYRTAKAISDATGGLVTVADLCEGATDGGR